MEWNIWLLLMQKLNYVAVVTEDRLSSGKQCENVKTKSRFVKQGQSIDVKQKL